MAKMEKLSEKEMRMRITDGEDSPMDFQPSRGGGAAGLVVDPWPSRLIPIDLPETTIRPEVRSLEREIQAKREQTTLAMLVFKSFLPDSASEPDANSDVSPPENIKTKFIPLEDTNDAALISHNLPQSTTTTTPTTPTTPTITTAPSSNPAMPHSPTPLTTDSGPGSPPLKEKPAILPQDHILNITSKILPTDTAAQSLKTILDAIKHTLPSTNTSTTTTKSAASEANEIRKDYSSHHQSEGIYNFKFYF